MLRLFALSIQVVRDVPVKGNKGYQVATTSAATWLILDEQAAMYVQDEGMEEAEIRFPPDAGFYDHAVAIEEVPFDAIADIMIENQKPQRRVHSPAPPAAPTSKQRDPSLFNRSRTKAPQADRRAR